mmetsp:Transcript_120062/g.245481  ORF Transcript_120062/g.245481 Transcript_120062/m.245481 type:complete len:91 (+) Transcript_120062:1105-1377(+)
MFPLHFLPLSVLQLSTFRVCDDVKLHTKEDIVVLHWIKITVSNYYFFHAFLMKSCGCFSKTMTLLQPRGNVIRSSVKHQNAATIILSVMR